MIVQGNLQFSTIPVGPNVTIYADPWLLSQEAKAFKAIDSNWYRNQTLVYFAQMF